MGGRDRVRLRLTRHPMMMMLPGKEITEIGAYHSALMLSLC